MSGAYGRQKMNICARGNASAAPRSIKISGLVYELPTRSVPTDSAKARFAGLVAVFLFDLCGLAQRRY